MKTCPVCQKTFKTKEQLAQHRSSKHSTNPHPVSKKKSKKVKNSHSDLLSKAEKSGFLKCAFAAFDQADKNSVAIPDQFQGKIIPFRSDTTQTVTVKANTTTTIVVLSSPGNPFYLSEEDNLNSIYRATYDEAIDDVLALRGDHSDRASHFRTVSNVVDIFNVSSSINAGGTIKVCRFNLERSVELDNATRTEILTYNGFPISLNRDVYVDNLKYGANSVGVRDSVDFDFTPLIQPGVPVKGGYPEGFTIPMNISTPDGTPASLEGVEGKFVTRGIGDNYGRIFQFTAPDHDQTLQIRVNACYEFTPVPNTLLFEVASGSPPYDPAIIWLYKIISSEMPLAVRVSHNPDFWQFVRNIIQRSTGVLSHLPGPYGMIAGGINELLQ